MMRPSIPLVLAAAIRRCDDLIGAETDPIKAIELNRFRLIFRVLNRDWGDVVVRRLEEIAALQGILRSGAEISPPTLRGALEEALEKASVADLTAATLETAIDQLLRALIQLHGWLETESSEAAQAQLREIWSILESRTLAVAVDDSLF